MPNLMITPQEITWTDEGSISIMQVGPTIRQGGRLQEKSLQHTQVPHLSLNPDTLRMVSGNLTVKGSRI